jgi:hypothetical protein
MLNWMFNWRSSDMSGPQSIHCFVPPSNRVLRMIIYVTRLETYQQWCGVGANSTKDKSAQLKHRKRPESWWHERRHQVTHQKQIQVIIFETQLTPPAIGMLCMHTCLTDKVSRAAQWLVCLKLHADNQLNSEQWRKIGPSQISGEYPTPNVADQMGWNPWRGFSGRAAKSWELWDMR